MKRIIVYLATITLLIASIGITNAISLGNLSISPTNPSCTWDANNAKTISFVCYFKRKNVTPIWSVADQKIGTIDFLGNFTPKKAGNTYVIAQYNGERVQTLITVHAPVGWSSATKYGSADTPIRQRIYGSVAVCTNTSGQSVTSDYWGTDVSDGDGTRILNSIKAYGEWAKKGFKEKAWPDTEKKMKDAFSGSGYTADSIAKFIERIKTVYKSNSTIPTDSGNGVLKYLGMRKQCYEWVITKVLEAGGNVVRYADSNSVDLKDVKVGMGYYNTSGTTKHAMIIIDINFDKAGKATKFKVAEANMPLQNQSTWSNPPGQIPWERTVRTDREVPIGLKIVRFDNDP